MTAMRITLLKVSNFQKIKDVEIAPGGRNLMLIGGNNKQGKTSLLSAMSAALGGGKAKPDRPVRTGAKSAEIVVELDNGDTVITRTFGDKGKATLKVVTKELGKISSPQVALDKIVGSRFLDPLAFANLNQKAQREELIKVVDIGIDLEQNARQRKRIFGERTDANRDVKRLTAEAGAFAKVDSIPARVEMQKLVDSLDDLNASAKQSDDAAYRHELLLSNAADAENIVADLEEQIVKAKASASALREVFSKEREALTEIAAMDFSDEIAAVRDSMGECDEHNAKVAKLEATAEAANAVAGKLFDAESTAADLDKQLRDLDKAKADALAAARMPVDGLSLDDDAVLLNGVPLSQASGAESLQLSLAIAASTNPQLRDIWMRDGSLLDNHSMQLVSKFADDNDLVLWIEVVGDDRDDCIIMEDGAIRHPQGDS